MCFVQCRLFSRGLTNDLFGTVSIDVILFTTSRRSVRIKPSSSSFMGRSPILSLIMTTVNDRNPDNRYILGDSEFYLTRHLKAVGNLFNSLLALTCKIEYSYSFLLLVNCGYY